MSADSLQDVISAVQDIIGSLSGIRVAPDYAPDSLAVFPASVVYPAAGTFTTGPADNLKGLHNIVVEIHVERRDLVKALKAAIPYGTLAAKALLGDVTLGGTVSTFGQITYDFGPMAWGDPALQTLGWRLTIENIKTQESMS